MPHQVLIVEDDDGIAQPLVRTLQREGYIVSRAATGAAAIERIRDGDVDLVVLDLGLPDLDGLDVCRRARAEGYESAILILTARGGELDRVVGLDVGADDYLAKPFALAELLARSRALLRRTAARPSAAGHSAPPQDQAVPGIAAAGAPGAQPASLQVDVRARRVWVNRTEVPLTIKEFGLIALLSEHPGVVLTREQLMDRVWDENWFGSTKTLDVTMGRLRQKLEDAGSQVRIVTVRGVGFRLEPGPPDA